MSTNTDNQNQVELTRRQISQRQRRKREKNNPTAPKRTLPIFSTPNQYALGQHSITQSAQREKELVQRRSPLPMILESTNPVIMSTSHVNTSSSPNFCQQNILEKSSKRVIAQRARREREKITPRLSQVEASPNQYSLSQHLFYQRAQSKNDLLQHQSSLPLNLKSTHPVISPPTTFANSTSSTDFQQQAILGETSKRTAAQRARREREKNAPYVSQFQASSSTINNPNIIFFTTQPSQHGSSSNRVNIQHNFLSTTQRFLNIAENGTPDERPNIVSLQPSRCTLAQRARRERERNAPHIAQRETTVLPQRHYLGRMDVRCKHCNALHWLDEKLEHSSKINPLFGSCCLQGKVKLPPISPLPTTFQALYEGTDELSRSFQEDIRSYNAANAFSSLGVKLDDRVLSGYGPKAFTIHGQLHHNVGSLLPDPDKHPTYAQLYIYDAQTALNYRQQRNPHLRQDVLHLIQDTLLQNNQLCKVYKNAYEILNENNSEINEIYACLHHKEGTDQRRYNHPSSNEIAVIMPGDGSIPLSVRDIVLRLRGRGLERISECHPLYLPSHYVLLFPNGDLGWSLDHKLWDIDLNTWSNKRMPQLHYHGYRMFECDGEYSSILRGGPLFEEYMVDAWAAYEQNRLYYIKTHQIDIRAECYKGLIDIVRDGVSLEEIGQRYILPSTHIGSPRHMYEIYQDSMAITRYNKHPDIFLTMTANPSWPEITNELKHRQKVTDRPDLVARVFELKRQALLDQIVEKEIFGKVAAYVFTIEFQKRGLPHMHALIFLKHPYKINTCAQVDRIVCAEFPDPIAQPNLFETIKKCMIHGPCGKDINPNARCMEKGVCKDKYPRVHVDFTSMDRDGYPLYQRRDTGIQYKVRGHMVDNQNVVPYNPHLSAMFDAHINVEVCASVRAVKYIHKYIYKGSNKATMVFVGVEDEIQQYIDARYVGSPEAAHRILRNPMHKEWPNVVRLALYLPGMNKIPYNINETPEKVLARAENENTTLTAFFKYNYDNPGTPPYTYQEFPEHFVWEKSDKVWKPRTQGLAIGRIYFASPNCGERFYLRLLLTVVKAPDSFNDLKKVGTEQFNTFKEACIARGLLEDDEEWAQCLEEASSLKTGHQLRKLFSVILLECSPTQPGLLWERFASKICDDCAYLLQKKFHIQNPTTQQATDYGLYLLQEICTEAGRELSDIPGMPLPATKWKEDPPNRYMTEQSEFLHEGLEAETNANHNRLNAEQLFAFDEITDSTLNNKGKVFFLNGPAGTGKTFVYNTIASSCRLQGKIVVMVASSGITSLLLIGGRTAHSTFKLPLEIMDNSNCGFAKNSERAIFLKHVDLIIWDEVPMQHRYCVEAVNRTLQDIRNNEDPFGGVTVVLGGDFRQTLPIIIKGMREDFVGASLQRSPLWKHVNVLNLVQNMRLDAREEENIEFANYLMQVGSNPTDSVELPNGIKRCKELEDLITTIYPGIENANQYATSYLTERTILSARNDDVSIINDATITKFPGQTTEYLSADKVVEEDVGYEAEGYHYTTEFLNSLDRSCLPPFKMKLKIGCPIMLLRNIARRDGLCNGTRLMVLQCRPRVIEAMILTGNKAGDKVFIPRITLTPSTSELPFKMSRRQFPVRLAFAMTINKSQGQSVNCVGIDLRTPVFSHGQLYVALSRCTSSRRISVILPPEDQITTTNVVYPEVLLQLLREK